MGTDALMRGGGPRVKCGSEVKLSAVVNWSRCVLGGYAQYARKRVSQKANSKGKPKGDNCLQSGVLP